MCGKRAVRQVAELIEIIAAVNDARIDERRGFGWHAGTYPALVECVNGEWRVKPSSPDKAVGG